MTKKLVKHFVRQAREILSDDPMFAHAPRGAFVETMWNDDERNTLGLDRDDYLDALRQAWRQFYKSPV